LVARTMSLTSWICEEAPPDTLAMYCMIRFAASVFPAPDSPLRALEKVEARIPDDDTLVVFITLHVVKGGFGDGKDVRRHLLSES